jgi:hypothetical protein
MRAWISGKTSRKIRRRHDAAWHRHGKGLISAGVVRLSIDNINHDNTIQLPQAGFTFSMRRLPRNETAPACFIRNPF